MIGYSLKSLAVIGGDGIEIPVVVGIKQHDRLSRTLADIVDVVSYGFRLKSVSYIYDTVDVVRIEKVKKLFFVK